MDYRELFPMAPSLEFRRSGFQRKYLSRCKINLFATFLPPSPLRIGSFLLGPHRPSLGRLFTIIEALWLVMVSASPAASPDDSLLVYAVNIHQTPIQSWGPGYGIYLGK